MIRTIEPNPDLPPVRGDAREVHVIEHPIVFVGSDITITVSRAPEGSQAVAEENEFTPDLPGCYTLNVSGQTHEFVAVRPECLERPELGTRPILTLRSAAKHRSEIPDAKWSVALDAINPMPTGVSWQRYGGRTLAAHENPVYATEGCVSREKADG